MRRTPAFLLAPALAFTLAGDLAAQDAISPRSASLRMGGRLNAQSFLYW